MKILYISDSVLPSRTANSIHVMNMTRAFAKIGHEVYLLTMKGDKDIDIYNYYGAERNFVIYNKINGKSLLSPIFFFFYCFFKIRTIDPDFIYGRGLFGMLAVRYSKYNYAYELHTTLNKSKKITTKIYNAIRKKIINGNNFKFLVVISDALKNILRSQNVDKDIFVEHDSANEPEDLTKISLESFNRPTLNIGYFGHLYKGRGLNIIKKLSEYFPQYSFHIVGGNDEDVNYYRKTFKDNRNIVLHGFVDPSVVHKYRNSCDILLAPYQKKVSVAGDKNFDSSKFMSPLKIFEYMSSRKAIICSDMPVIREVLNDKNSILVKPDDHFDWIKAIKTLENGKKRKDIAENAYTDFLEKYTWSKRAERISSIICKYIEC